MLAGIFNCPDTVKVVAEGVPVASGVAVVVPICAPVSALFNLRLERATSGVAVFTPAPVMSTFIEETLTPSAELVCNR